VTHLGDMSKEGVQFLVGVEDAILSEIVGKPDGANQRVIFPSLGRTWGGPSRTWGEAGRYQAVPQVSLIVISGEACGPSRTPGKQSRRTES
jgi:hypothetical protein